jgi:hypothetical protein
MSTPNFETHPDTCAASVVMNLTRVVGSTQSPFTLEKQNFKWPGEIWTIDFRLPPFTSRKTAMQWVSFGLNLEGTYGRFLMGDPSAKTPLGIATGTPLVDGAGQTGNFLVTKGWTPSQTGIMLCGDYIQIGTGLNARLHMVTADADSSAGGIATLRIAPSLRESPVDNAEIIVNDAKGLFKLTSNSFPWSVEPGKIYRVAFQAEEVINA